MFRNKANLMLVVFCFILIFGLIVTLVILLNIKWTWPVSSFPLRVFVDSGPPEKFVSRENLKKFYNTISNCLEIINCNSMFNFFQPIIEKNEKNSDVIISIVSNSQYLDGAGPILGVTFFPPEGKIFIDMDNKPLPIGFVYTLLHELGHSLGLEDTDVKNTVMFRYLYFPLGLVEYTKYDVSNLSFLYPTLKIKYQPAKPELIQNLRKNLFSFQPIWSKLKK